MTVTATTNVTYRVTLKVTDPSGCVSACGKTVNVHAAPTCAVEGPNEACAGAAGLRYCGPAGMAKYEWSIAGEGMFNPAPGFTDRCVTVETAAAGALTGAWPIAAVTCSTRSGDLPLHDFGGERR